MKIGIFGATGLIGRTFLKILEENKIYIEPRLFASEKSYNKELLFHKKKYKIEMINQEAFSNLDWAFFFVPSEIAKTLKEYAKLYNVKVIDNSSCFRLEKDIPLIIPDMNIALAKNKSYIANPNCSTIQSVLPLYYLDKEFDLKEVNYATYQSLSGGGNKLLNEKNLKFESVNPFIGKIDDNNYSEEENKMVKETQKLLNKSLIVRAMCVRTKASYCHGIYVDALFNKEVDLKLVSSLFSNTRIKVSDDIECQKDKNDILITRLRIDLFDNRRLQFFVLADNLRVGASYNSYLIAKYLNVF